MTGLSHILSYVKDVAAVCDFYTSLFGYRVVERTGDRILELVPAADGARLLLQPAATAARQGQAQAKLVFRIEDVPAFCTSSANLGYPFGVLHRAGDYCFANTRDPAGNSVQVTSRPN